MESSSSDPIPHSVHPDPPILPVDLLYEIIDHLHDDRKALCTFALVSKQALSRSRSHLASRLIFIGGTEHPKDRLDSLLPILDVPWTSFSSSIKELCFFSYIWATPKNWNETPTRIFKWSQDYDYERIARNLANLKVLSVARTHWMGTPDEIRYLFSLCKIREFHVHGVMVFKDLEEDTYPSVFTWIDPLKIQKLSFRNVRASSVLDDALSTLNRANFPKIWNFKRCDMSSLMSLASVIDALNISELRIQIDEFQFRPSPGFHGSQLDVAELRSLFNALSSLLQTFRSTVKRLSIHQRVPCCEDLGYMEIAHRSELELLSNLHNVEALHLWALHPSQSMVSYRQNPDEIQSVIKKLPTDNLTHIYLSFANIPLLQAGGFAWEIIENSVEFLRQYCKALSRIVLRFCVDDPTQQYVEDLLREGRQRFEGVAVRVSLQIYNLNETLGDSLEHVTLDVNERAPYYLDLFQDSTHDPVVRCPS